jgi:dTDP-4-dehydrorhamnose 3,5-epimerase
MRFIEAELSGAFIVELNPFRDSRGMFMRTFCKKEFAAAKLVSDFVQCNTSRSDLKATLRGMHFQANGSEEVKVVRCTRGKVQDVIIDLRSDSPSFCQYFSIELSEDNDKMLYVPIGFAHGFLTLEPNSEVSYMVSNFYSSINERGVRWNDKAFNIQWNLIPIAISEKDASHPDFIRKP